MPSRRRLLLYVPLALGLSALLLVGALHTRWARDRVLVAVLARIAPDGSIEASQLDYNLLALRVRLHDVRMRSPGQEPYFSADRVAVQVPWSALSGRLGLREIELERPRFTVYVAADGTTNFAGGGLRIEDPLPLERLALSGLQIVWDDEQRGFRLDANGIDLSLGSDVSLSTLALPDGAGLRLGDRSTPIGLASGGLDWDGLAGMIDQLRVESPAFDAEVDGTIGGLLSDRDLALSLGADLRLAEIGELAGINGDLSGDIRIEADVQGTAAAPQATARISAADLGGGDLRLTEVNVSARFDGGFQVDEMSIAAIRWRDIELTDVVATASLGETLILRDVSAGFRGGRLDASGAIALEPSGVSALRLAWDAIPTASLGAQAGIPAGLALDSISDGSVHLDWPGMIPEQLDSIVAQAQMELRPGVRGRGMQLSGSILGRLESGALRSTGRLRSASLGRVEFDLAVTVDQDDPWNSPVHSSMSLEATDLGRIADRLGEILPELDPLPAITGAATFTGVLGGTFAAPTLGGEVSVRQLTAVGSGPLDLDSAIRMSGDRLALRDVVVRLAGAEVQGEVQTDLEGSAVEGSVRGSVPEIAELLAWIPESFLPAGLPRTTGALEFDLSFAGAVPFPAFAGTIGAHAVQMEGLGATVEATTTLRQEAGWTLIDRLTLSTPDGYIEATGRLAPGGMSGELAVELDFLDLAALLDRPDLGAVGRMHSVLGTQFDLATGATTLTVERLSLDLPGFPVETSRPATIRWDDAGLSVDDIQIWVGNSILAIDGALEHEEGAGIAAVLEGDLAEFDDLAALAVSMASSSGASVPPEIRLRGSLRAELEVNGTLQKPRPSGRLEIDDGALTVGQIPPFEDIAVHLTVGRDAAYLSDSMVRWQGATLRASGEAPLDYLLPESLGLEPAPSPMRANLRLESLTPAALRPWLPAAYADSLQGIVSGSLEVSAASPDLESIVAQATLDELRLSLDDTTVEQSRPTRLEMVGGVVRVLDWEWLPRSSVVSTPGLALGLSGIVDLRGAEPQYALSATGDMRLAWLAPLVTTGLLDGRALFGAEVGGSGFAPVVSGSLQLEAVNWVLREPRLALSNLEGTVVFAEGHVSTTGLRGTVNDGDLLILLEADLTDMSAPTGLLGVTGRRVALQAAGARTEADIDLTVSARSSDDLRAFGTITLEQGGYRSARSLASELRSALASTARPALAAAEPSLMDRMDLDIRIRTEQDLIVDTTFADLGLELDLRVVGTAARPGLLGTGRMQEGGRFRLSGSTYSIERGLVEFADPARIAPRLDIQAGTRISRYEVNVSITGDAFAPTVSASSSDSALSEADIFSLMATGRTLQDAGGQGNQILREQAFAMLSGQIQGVTRALGIDSVRLEREQRRGVDTFVRSDDTDLFPRTTDLATRITFSRSFAELFKLAFSQNLGEAAAQSWVGTLELPRGVQLRGGTFDDGTRSAELRHQLTFGGPPRAKSAARPRVGEIEVSGDLALTREELMARLRLRPGDRFDYLDWQRDQDRLLQLLRERGYREARVSPRRQSHATGSGAQSSVDLSYEIAAGPETRLTLRGADVPERVVAQMHRAWNDSIADAFLLVDLEQIARSWLVREGFQRAGVSVEVTAEEPVKEVLVLIEPGARAARAEIAFAGNTSVSAGELRRRLAREDLVASAWHRPETAAEALTVLYRERGFLAARVVIDEPRVGETGAILPVQVEEGPRARLAAVSVEGNRHLAETELLEATGLRPRDSYVPLLEEEAASAIRSRYLDAGFNSARVLPVVSTSLDGADVDLLFRVEEGPRQVLGEITIDGRARTREGVVRGALAVEVGAPIGSTEVERLRRRLLEIGAFRSVTASLEPLAPADGGEQSVRLRVTVQETAPFDLRYGFQLLDLQVQEDQRERKPGLGAILTHRNFLGVGATASVLARVRSDEVFGRGSLTFRRLFGAPIRTSLIAQQARRDIDSAFFASVRRTETVLQLQQTLPLGNSLSLGYSFNYERSRTTIADSAFQPNPITVTRLVPSLVHDSRDGLLAPRRGWFHASTLELALAGLGSELEFRKYSAQQYAFVPFGPVVSATAIRFGTGTSLDPASTNLPPSELFRAGGATTVRGYPENSLGRTPFFGSFFEGGDAVLILNHEFRARVLPWLEGVAFIDAGSTFSSLGEVSLSRLKASTGAGLRLLTPYITLRLDYGIRLSDVEASPAASRGRFHFGIGHIF